MIAESRPEGQESAASFKASVILGGQIKGGEPTLFLIYPEGNFIEVTDDSPFFQIGEAKYGKPILVRAYDPAMSFEEAIKLLLVSFDSTIKANLSVGMPLDVQTYDAGSLSVGTKRRIEADDPYYQAVSSSWGDALRQALTQLPAYGAE